MPFLMEWEFCGKRLSEEGAHGSRLCCTPASQNPRGSQTLRIQRRGSLRLTGGYRTPCGFFMAVLSGARGVLHSRTEGFLPLLGPRDLKGCPPLEESLTLVDKAGLPFKKLLRSDKGSSLHPCSVTAAGAHLG